MSRRLAHLGLPFLQHPVTTDGALATFARSLLDPLGNDDFLAKHIDELGAASLAIS